MVSKEDIQKEHVYLKETIRFHNNKYHSEDNPEISDQEFDQLFKQLKELEKKYKFLYISDSPSNIVGAIKLSELSSFEHLIPMLSLDNAFSEEDLSDFEKRNQNKIKEKVNLRTSVNIGNHEYSPTKFISGLPKYKDSTNQQF